MRVACNKELSGNEDLGKIMCPSGGVLSQARAAAYNSSIAKVVNARSKSCEASQVLGILHKFFEIGGLHEKKLVKRKLALGMSISFGIPTQSDNFRDRRGNVQKHPGNV